MLNRVNSVINPSMKLQSTNQTKSVVKTKMMETDKSDISKSDIPAKLFSFKDGITQKEYDMIVEKFNLNANQATFKSDTFAIYDISKYANEFPFDLQNAEVISHQSHGNDSMLFTLRFSTKENPLPTTIEVEIKSPYKNVELLDENTFKNTVLKAMIIATEKIKLDESVGHKIPNKYSVGLEFDKSNKKANFEELKNYLVKSYNFLIEKNYSDDMIKKYKGHYNLNIDPELVKKSQLELSKIIDEVINDLL